MKSIIDSLNYYQLMAILWCVSLVISIFRRKPIDVLLDAVVVIINLALGEWVW